MALMSATRGTARAACRQGLRGSRRQAACRATVSGDNDLPAVSAEAAGAEEEAAPPPPEPEEEEPRTLSFAPNTAAARGYTAEDSAGQSNIFAVEPKIFVAGADDDETGSGSETAVIAGVGLAFAGIAAFALVSSGGNGAAEPDVAAVPFDGAETLSYYLDAFADKPAPVDAPALAEE